MVLTNPPFGRKSSMTFVNEEGEVEPRGPRRRARRLLGVDLEQAAQLRPAREDAARRSTGVRRSSCPTTCSSRAARARRFAASCSHECDVHTLLRLPTGDLLRAGREGERALLRPQAGVRDAVDARALGLRPAHEPALHAEAEPAARASTSTTSSTATSRMTRASARSRSGSSASPTTSCSRATRSASTSSGCATSRSRTSTTSRRRT